MAQTGSVTFDVEGLQDLLDVLGRRGFTVLGPTVRDRAVVPGRVRSVADLPGGWGDVQEPGSYRLRRRGDDALFGYAADAISWKAAFFPSRELVWSGSRTAAPPRAERGPSPGHRCGRRAGLTSVVGHNPPPSSASLVTS